MAFLTNIKNIFYRAFPTPKLLTLDPFAIEICSQSILLLKLNQTSNGLEAVCHKEYPLKNNTAGFLRDQSLAKEEILIALRKIRDEFKVEHVIPVIPDTESYTFSTELPAEAKDSIESAIRFNLEENVPMPASQVLFDYQVCHNCGKPGSISVVVTAVGEDIVKKYTELFGAVNIKPISFVSESASLGQSLVRPGDSTPHLIVRLERDRALMVIVEFGLVQYSSSISLDLENSISDLESPGAVALKEAINKLLIYWFTGKHNAINQKKIDSVIIVGELASNPDLADFFEKQVKLKATPANIWTNCFDLNEVIPKIKFEESLKYPALVGAAISSYNVI